MGAAFHLSFLLSLFVVVRGLREGAAGTCKVTSSRPLYLLISRHGFSCANTVEKYAKNGFIALSHNIMRDPGLTDAGREASKRAAKDIEDFLRQRSLTIDAVLASVLVRAMETALLQYTNESRVHVVPHISEVGTMLDNRAMDEREQNMYLGPELAHRLNHTWINKYSRKEGGNWTAFRSFLASEFLPTLAQDGKKRAESTAMVLAVVTHSNLMAQGELKQKCSHLYPNTHKPNNNQAFVLKYEFRTYDYCLSKVVDLTVGIEAACALVADGMPLGEFLCMRDVGVKCMKQLHDLKMKDFLKTFGEKRFIDAANETSHLASKVNKISQEIADGRADRIKLEKLSEALDILEKEQHAVSKLDNATCLDGDPLGKS